MTRVIPRPSPRTSPMARRWQTLLPLGGLPMGAPASALEGSAGASYGPPDLSWRRGGGGMNS